MQFSTKIALSFIVVITLTTGVLLGIMVFEKQSLKKSLSSELKEHMRHRTTEVLQPVYKLCEEKEAQTIPLLQKDLRNASFLIKRMGGMSLGDDSVPWEVINTKGNRFIELPMMLIGKKWLEQNKDPHTHSTVVDDIRDLSGTHCNIFQRINPEGDMIIVSTSSKTMSGSRAIGTIVSHMNPDSTQNEMINNIVQGEQYLEHASYKNGWVTLICEPIYSIKTKQIIGCLSVSLKQKETVQAIRQIILKTSIGKSGYMWVVGSKGERRGVYIISKDGLRDGESLWDIQDNNGQYFVRTIVEEALQSSEGEVKFFNYPWINPGESHQRMKIAAFTYFEPWDWIIGSSAYEDDFQDTQIRVDKSLGNMLYLTLCVGFALVLCSILVGYFVHKTIRSYLEKTQKQAKELERISNYKSDFLANMSHEIRTPMNVILGFTQLMMRDAYVTPEQRENLQTISQSAEHLLSLINDVLEFSKIEAGRTVINQENFDLHQFILSLEQMFRLRAEKKGFFLDFKRGPDVPQYIRTDPNKLRQILINLLGNAVKYTKKGGITLSVDKAVHLEEQETGGCILHFEVSDTGVGISPEELENIFDAFYQSGSRQSSQEGTGLGLPISQRFVSMMEGALNVKSEVGKGTCFIFDIPVGIADAVVKEKSLFNQKVIALEASQPVFRLLVVEDNVYSRKMLAKLLRIVGFEVWEAVNGREAIEKWKEWNPHLIWMDLRMPVMDGYEATRYIRTSPEGQKVVIIALTASAFEEDRVKVIESGCNDFIRKPFKESDIFETMHKHLGVRFVYEEEGGSLKPAVIPANIIDKNRSLNTENLPVELIKRLKEATELSDTSLIDKTIDEIRTHNVQLADALSDMADNFAYDAILDFVK